MAAGLQAAFLQRTCSCSGGQEETESVKRGLQKNVTSRSTNWGPLEEKAGAVRDGYIRADERSRLMDLKSRLEPKQSFVEHGHWKDWGFGWVRCKGHCGERGSVRSCSVPEAPG